MSEMLSEKVQSTSSATPQVLKDQKSHLQLYGHKLIYHLETLEKWLAGEQFFPLHLDIGPFGGCNHRCVHCYVEYLGHQGISLKRDPYLKLMKDIGDCGVKSIFLAGTGEPLLNKATADAIVTARSSGVDVAMATNGAFLKPEVADKILGSMTWLRFSMLGDSKETYTKIQSRNEDDWAKVKSNMEYAAELRAKKGYDATLGVYMCVLPENVGEVVSLTRRVKETGFDYIIVKPPTQNPKNNFSFPRDMHLRYRDALEEAKALQDDRFNVFVRFDLFGDEARVADGKNVKSYDTCYGLPFIAVVDADGGLYTCTGYWRNKEYCYGNLYENSFKEIWTSQQQKNVRNFVETSVDFNKCEPLCRQHNINKFLWQVKNPPNHHEFI